jgi:hypothetical protein
MEDNPPIITHLRERLAAFEASGREEGMPCVTVVGRGIVRALGVRGTKVAEAFDGLNTYVLSGAECRRALAKFDALKERAKAEKVAA